MGHQEGYRAGSQRPGRRGYLRRKRTRQPAHDRQVTHRLSARTQGGRMVVRTVSCVFLFALGILAQSGGTITGTVVNLSGDPVAKAVIQATNSETKAVYKATTSAAGGYTLAQLAAGTYQLASGTPFLELVEKNVKVTAAETLQLNLHLADVQLNTLG